MGETIDAATLEARLGAQLLVQPGSRDPVSVVAHLLAVQAQDLRAAKLAIRARSRDLTAADVDRAIDVDRSLVVGWLNRGTLHLVRAEDYWWLHELTTPQLETGTRRRLAQEGVARDDVDRGLRALVRALQQDGSLTRSELRDRVAAAGVRAAGQAIVHLLSLATLQGVIVRGPLAGDEQAFVLAADWLPPRPEVDHDVARAELVRRYLAAHGPASVDDLARWAGMSLTAARAGLAAAGREVQELADGLADLERRERRASPGVPPPRLLGAFDPLLLGWRSREPVLGEHASDVVSGGVFRAFVLVGGRAAGLWRLSGGSVTLSPFAPLEAEVATTLEEDGRDVVRFLGGSPQAPRVRRLGGAGVKD